ncbi:tetratricopeptide repeat protein [Sulfuricurvum sp.]|uniref:tetratricopeptide repeat protein n=1 Tax=Sulfuricurvum sp. TaxID=2025608 RepID=UPI002E2EB6F4|nr:tetratricopeptide repeat protein [Sulfuricurvum sp.]HEX5329066.1 tetratricopeptide repeat protein [Sulfuricurvum sp.]
MSEAGQAFLALILSGDLFLNDNQNDEAISCYLKAANIENIRSWDKSVVLRFYNNLAIAYKRKGDLVPAQKLFEQAIAIDSAYPLSYLNLFNLYKTQNRIADAEALLLKALSRNINDIRFHLSLIEFNNQRKNFRKALEIAIDCVKKFRGEYQAHLTLGNCFATLKLYKNAIDPYSAAINIKPEITSAYNNIGVAYKELGEYEKARAAYQKVLELNPNDSAVHNNLGNLLRNFDDMTGAIRHLEHSIRLNPSYADAYSNLGAVYKENKQYAEAEAFYRKAISLAPNHTNANFDLSLIELSKGEYKNGWQRYEHRIKMDELRSKIHHYKTPMWRGENLHGKTIILQNEQGFGDNIMFIRYVPLFVELGATIILRTRPELVRLFESVKGVEKVYSEEDEIPEHDYYLPLLSSPTRFKTTIETIPKHFPYIIPRSQEISDFKCNKKSFNIGLVWSSSRTNKDFKNKYIGLEHFKMLFAIKGTTWYSLQAGEDAQEIKVAKLENKITDLSERLVNFSATAAIIEKLDLIITTDTAIAHLCGAMDKKAWVLVPKPADWRWMQEGKSTPWYNSLELFRQHQKGSWNEVISEIKDKLSQRIK